MHQHGPSDLTGPLRGTPAWWHGADGSPETAEGETPAPRTRKKGKRMARTKRGARTRDEARPELIERIRQEIAAGTYDSPEKWEAALDRLLNRLESD
jgi:negative regulator of flagellin synthesis FlgM